MAEVSTVIAGVGVCASICRCFTGDNICCRMCKRCCKSEDTSDSPGQSTPARISNWIFDICTCKDWKCLDISNGTINCCSCHKAAPVQTGPPIDMTASSRRDRLSDTRGATASEDERTSLLTDAEVHTGTGNAQPTAPPEENTGLDSSPVTNQPTSRVSLAKDMSHGRQSTHITASSTARGEQTSAGQDATDAAESQQMADQPAIGTTATSERQISAGQDSTDAAESQQMADQPAISTTATSERQSSAGQDSTDTSESQQSDQPAVSTTVTSEGQSTASQDSVHAAESQQMAAQPAISAATREVQSSASQDSANAAEFQHGADQPAISTAATREGQSSAGLDSVDTAESQQTADQPAISTATREGQSSASQDSVDAAESQQMAAQPAISSTATRVGPTYVSQDSVHAAESVQMQAQPAVISRTSTTEGQSSAGLDSVDVIVAGRNQHASIGPHTVPTSHGTPASTVPSASNEQHPPMNQQPLATAEAQPPARNPPPDASSTGSRSDSVPQNPNKRVTKEHMQKLASLIVDWPRLASLLGTNPARIHAYRVDNNTEWNRTYAMLCGWLNRAYKEATVGSLFIKCQEADVDVEVYDYLLNI